MFNGGCIRVFAGSQPTNSDMAENSLGATLIGYITNGGAPPGFFGAGLNIVQLTTLAANDPLQFWVLKPIANGAASWFRYVADPNDSGGLSYSALRFDGAVGDTTATKELILPSTTLTFGSPLAPIQMIYTIPAAL
jgi:hypothetical protein